jgi:hypothetical protein
MMYVILKYADFLNLAFHTCFSKIIPLELMSCHVISISTVNKTRNSKLHFGAKRLPLKHAAVTKKRTVDVTQPGP